MLYQGHSMTVALDCVNVATVTLDLVTESVNKFDENTLCELAEAVDVLKHIDDLQGVVFTSAKEVFVVGADITEFITWFKMSDEALTDKLRGVHNIFNDISNLPCPTVAAINGIALGGGMELSLACDYRVMAESAKIGLPEVKLGIYPGWGGCVRLPRLIGPDNACEWICGGAQKNSAEALKDGVVDAVIHVNQVTESARHLIQQVIEGKLDYRRRRVELRTALTFSPIEKMMVFESVRGVVGAKAGKHYPAPMAAIKAIEKGISQTLDVALETEMKGFIKLAKGAVAHSLVNLFLNDQLVKKNAGHFTKKATPVEHAAVLGAGIMGGGIAYQSASKGTPILMKDIRSEALSLGIKEAKNLLCAQIGRGRLNTDQALNVMSSITPVLSYGEFARTDFVVEAVVENSKVKQLALAEVEQKVEADTIIASNTSTISITELATVLARPENFCGMHFFNPVHRMPLVEVIRGEKTSDAAIAKTVAYAQAIGKTPIVVNDCPGFFVNRVLFPYFSGFSLMMQEDADFQLIDKTMEKLGWPMGPAYLLDVIGIDTAHHAGRVMAEGFPDRMQHGGESAIDRLFKLERYGQKNGKGFYCYEMDKKGRPQKQFNEETQRLLEGVATSYREFDEEDIVARMMIPLCIETVRCLEEGIIGSAAEADIGLVYGIGFPAYLGGAMHYIDQMGLQKFCDLTEKYRHLGKLYDPTENMKTMAQNGHTYYGV